MPFEIFTLPLHRKVTKKISDMANNLEIKKRKDEYRRIIGGMEVGTTEAFPADESVSVRDIVRSYNNASERHYTTVTVEENIHITRQK